MEKKQFEVLRSKQFMEAGENITVFIPPRGFAGAKMHRHNYIELNYVSSGRFRQIIEGNEIISEMGDVCIMDTMAAHAVQDMTGDGVLVNILMEPEFFDTSFLNRLSNQGGVATFLVEAVLRNRKEEHYIYFPSHQNKRVSTVMEAILFEFSEKNVGYLEVWNSYMVILFTELLRTVKKEAEKTETPERANILKLLSYIEKNYKSCTLSDTAKEFNLSPNYLTTLLKRHTGKSFLDHIQQQKMKQAKYYLDNTDLSVSEIARLCGYANLNFFYKLFEKEEGMTPASYRKLNKRKNGQ
ncbi:AraC family transcriptional regulator [Konateibacter massiliensis]|uniref:AraC family transcriptional regulator n=1 Tax=Konateibacter massiliensis TaxID=2002841 RepID=UPI0015D4DD39|nr:AraC family transcriptional regulator [Konateibacter massiliensis]